MLSALAEKASITPLIGWFVLTSFIAVMGFGGFLLGFLRYRNPQQLSEETRADTPPTHMAAPVDLAEEEKNDAAGEEADEAAVENPDETAG